MSRKNGNPGSTQVLAEKAPSRVPQTQDRGAGKIQVLVRSETMRMLGNDAFEVSPALLILAKQLAGRIPRIFAGTWRSETIRVQQHCYAFDVAPVSSKGKSAELDQVFRDVTMRLKGAIQKMQEIPNRRRLTSLRELDISTSMYRVLRCLRAIEDDGGKVELVLTKPAREVEATDVTNRLVPSQLVDGSLATFDGTAVQIPISAPGWAGFYSLARDYPPAVRVYGRVDGVHDMLMSAPVGVGGMPQTGVAISVAGGRPMFAPELRREMALELYSRSAVVQGLLISNHEGTALRQLRWSEEP